MRVANVAILALALAACTSGPPPPDLSGYADEILSFRAEKDEFFLRGSESPVPPERRDLFLPLAYYAVDDRYRVAAALVPSPDEPVLVMPTSTGKQRPMRRAGLLTFNLLGEALEVTAFVAAEDVEARRLFVPFRDQTSGAETYVAGRYLDLDRTPTGLYDLDFNQAYNPYCYFNEAYDCPFPPPENELPLPVRAGERTRTDETS